MKWIKLSLSLMVTSTLESFSLSAQAGPFVPSNGVFSQSANRTPDTHFRTPPRADRLLGALQGVILLRQDPQCP
jgi:hypothetical protein